MWKSVKLHFSVNTKIIKVHHFFMGFIIQFCFQILNLEFVKNCLAKKKVIINFWEEKCDF